MKISFNHEKDDINDIISFMGCFSRNPKTVIDHVSDNLALDYEDINT